MTALPPEERPPRRSRPESSDPSPVVGGPAAGYPTPVDEVFDLLANVIAFQAAVEAHDLRRPGRGHPMLGRRWRREQEVLLLQRQVLKLRVESLPPSAFAPFPRPAL